MNRSIYIWLVIFISISACSEPEMYQEVPFKMMPNGLKKSIEAELIEKMENEVIECHIQLDKYYCNSSPIAFQPELRNIFEIHRNTHKNLIIRGASNPKESIENLVSQFYLANEPLSSEQTRSYIQDYDYKFIDYPFYSTSNREQILKQIRRNKVDLQRAIHEGEPWILGFYAELVQVWEDKLKAIDALEIEELKEVHPYAHIEVFDAQNETRLSPLTTQALKGLIQVRDYASRKYFDLPYMDLYFQGTRFITPDAESKLAAIDHIFPVNIVHLSYAKLNNLLIDWEWDEPEYIPSP